MEPNCTDTIDNRRRYEEAVRELSQLMRQPRVGINYRRLYNRITVEPSGPRFRATLLVGREKWQAEVLLTQGGAAFGSTKPQHDPSTGYFGRRCACLGLAMGCVREEDTELLPFGYDANWKSDSLKICRRLPPPYENYPCAECQQFTVLRHDTLLKCMAWGVTNKATP